MKEYMRHSDYFLMHCGIPYNTMFIIDFDDTLFDTHAFKKARIKALRAIGVSDEDYQETYGQALKENNLFSYSNERHAELLVLRGYKKEKVFTALEETTGEKLREFLFSDTIDFLSKIKARGEPMVLLSLGESSFQELKVKGSGIAPYFDRRFMVQESKVQAIHELIDVGEKSALGGTDMWFINDKVEESILIKNKFPEIKIVLKKSESIEEEEYKQSNLPYFKILTEIYEYIGQKIR